MIASLLAALAAIAAGTNTDNSKFKGISMRNSCRDAVEKNKKAFPNILGNAKLISSDKFERLIIGRTLSYRTIDGNLTLTYPRETFFSGGKYLYNGTRFSASKTYSFQNGIITVTGDLFIGSIRAILMNDEDNLFMMTCNEGGGIYQILP